MAYEKSDIQLALVKVGVAVALSFAGFFYSRLNIRSIFCSVSHQLTEHDVGSDLKEPAAKNDWHVPRNTAEMCTSNPVYDGCLITNIDEKDMVLLSPKNEHVGDENCTQLGAISDAVSNNKINDCLTLAKDGAMPNSEAEASATLETGEKNNVEQEIFRLRRLVKDLQEREQCLEDQKLEFSLFKEQQKTITELQNRLTLNTMESKVLMLRVESLLEDNRRLNSQVADHQNLVAEVDTAREVIITSTKKLHDESKKNREHILILQNKVSTLLEQHQLAALSRTDTQDDYEKMKDLEDDADKVRRANWKLQQENELLARELDSAQVIANSIPNNPKTEELRELGVQLRKDHEELVKRLERLRTDRIIDADELAHQKSVNACLRYELQTFEPHYNKAFGTNLSNERWPRAEVRANQLILETEEQKETDLESCASFSSESVNSDLSFQSSKTSGSRKLKFFKKLKGFVSGRKDDKGNEIPFSLQVTEDPDFPPRRRVSTSSVQSSRFGPPPRSTGTSEVIQRTGSQRADSLKDTSVSRRNIDVGSSSRRKVLSVDKFAVEGEREQEDRELEKAELIKFAKILEDRNKKTEEKANIRKSHRHSSSVSSLDSPPQLPTAR